MKSSAILCCLHTRVSSYPVTSVRETVPSGKHAPLACAMDLVRGMLTISFNKVKGKVTPVHAMTLYRRGSSAPSLILRFGTRCRSVVNFTQWLLYNWRKDPAVPNKSGDWLGPSAGLGILEKRKTLAPARNQTPDCTACTLVTTLTMLTPVPIWFGIVLNCMRNIMLFLSLCHYF
jgi:hypothetical protein